jgi:hypothetical protein
MNDYTTVVKPAAHREWSLVVPATLRASARPPAGCSSSKQRPAEADEALLSTSPVPISRLREADQPQGRY